jgi:multicomponent Na+:H+ antiporter subunit C
MSVLLGLTAGLLFGIGTYVVLQRKLSRIIIGLGLLTHGANVLLITAGRRGDPPLVGGGSRRDFADPLPQALALTAVVITFALTTFLLALGYRSFGLIGHDEVQDDLEDRRIARGRGAENELVEGAPGDGVSEDGDGVRDDR